MDKILVTGGAGYIGSHTVVELHQAGFEPIIIDNFSSSDKSVLHGLESIIGRKVKVYEGDCRDERFVQQIFRIEGQISGIIHFAAFKKVGESVREPLKYFDNNVMSLLVMLRESLAAGVSNFVFSSSCTVYGEPDTLPVTENSPVKEAKSPYGSTKIIGETMLKDAVTSLQHKQNDKNLKVMSLRYFNPIGAHQSAKIGELPLGVPTNLVPFITQTAAGVRKELVVNGNDYNTSDGTCVRDYIHVMDVARAHVHALKFLKNSQESRLYEVLNLGIGKGYSVLEIINMFIDANGVNLPYSMGPRRPGDVEQVYAEVSLAEEKLDWKAEESIESALRHAWEWQKTLA